MYCGATLRGKRALMMMPSRTQRASRPANQVAGRVPNSRLNGRMPRPQRAHARARHCRRASVAVTVKSRPRHGAKAGHRRIVEVLRALVLKKRWVRGVVKRRMASLQRLRVDGLLMETVPRVVVLVRVTGAVTQVVVTLAAVRDLETQARVQVRGGPGPRVAHRAAVAATAAIHLPVDQATAVVAVVTTATAVALVPATQAVVVATTVAVRVVVVRAAAMVAATKAAAQAQAHRAHAGVIAASHRTDVAVAARAVAMAAVPVAAQAATVIAAAAVADSQATVGPHLQAGSALAEARAIVMA